MSERIKHFLRMIAPARHGSRVWQRHSALLSSAPRQQSRVVH